ncbi:hypothetical protein PRIO_3067 [Paenibacillus riograndensis SBR5]|uniref:YqkK n=2 Tax=Paenibacillus riograndensis TaxID=483937 RepID=A0A0E4CWM9_9BACL|nr:hypothetical protein [Paenibacillus riograndensis]CQR55470.1 hypothetical protein PRIO_3067 [Paenibacillus riograndensis SBR5]
MARTKTQKALLKAERSGTWCAERNRRLNDHYGAISQHVRVTPSKQQKLNKVKHKERIFQDGAPFAYPGEQKLTSLFVRFRKSEIKGKNTFDWAV